MRTNTNIKAAVQEARRFIEKAEALIKLRGVDTNEVAERTALGQYAYESTFPAEQGAVKRASMDLTRALAVMRRPGCL